MTNEDLALESIDAAREGLRFNELSVPLRLDESNQLLNLVQDGRQDLVEEAATSIERAASLFPNAWESNHYAALHLVNLGEYERALSWADRTIQLSTKPADAQEALYLKAVSLGHLGQPDEAIALLQQALPLEPDSALAPTIQAGIDQLQQTQAQPGPAE